MFNEKKKELSNIIEIHSIAVKYVCLFIIMFSLKKVKLLNCKSSL